MPFSPFSGGITPNFQSEMKMSRKTEVNVDLIRFMLCDIFTEHVNYVNQLLSAMEFLISNRLQKLGFEEVDKAKVRAAIVDLWAEELLKR